MAKKENPAIYYLRLEPNGDTRIAKVVNDEVERPEAVYVIPKGTRQCQCWQAISKKNCRHLQMLDLFNAEKQKPMTIDFDRGRKVELINQGE